MAALAVFGITAVLAALTWKGFPSQGDPGAAAALARAAASLPAEYGPLTLDVSRDPGGSLRARVVFRDLSGGEIAVLERPVPGDGLVLDCWLVDPAAQGAGGQGSVSHNVLLFPRRLRGSAEAWNGGSVLFDAYSASGFPAIYGKPAAGPMDEGARKALAALFAALSRAESASARGPGSLPSGVKGVTAVLLVLPDPEPGRSYALVAGSDGRLGLSALRP